MEPKAWSISSLQDFTNCPKAFYEKRIAKSVVDPPNDAGVWGDYVHKEFEKYLKSESLTHAVPPHTLPDDLSQYEDYLNSIVAIPGGLYTERKYAINTNFEPCDFFADDVWCRGIIDVLVLNGNTARIIDHKTGKRKPGSLQLQLNALLVFIHHPEVQVVEAAYFWLKDKKFDPESFVRTDYAKLWNDFLPMLRPYLVSHQREMFPPRPSGLCNGWCPVQTCEYWKPKR